MAKFNFRLQKVLDYKLQLEEQSKLELKKANFELMKKQQELADVNSELEYIAKTIGSGKLNQDLIWLYKEMEKNLILSSDQIKKEIELLIQKIDNLRKDLLNKTIERKKMEKLKEKERDRFLYEEQKKEQKEISDIATFRYEKPFI